MNLDQAVTNLKHKGFQEITNRDHIYLWYFDYHGKKTKHRFHYSHNEKLTEKIPDFYIKSAKSSLGLSDKKEVIKLFDCTMSQAEYERIIFK